MSIKETLRQYHELSREKKEEAERILASRAGAHFVQSVMEDEGVDYDTALAMCMDGEGHPDIYVGWKMCDPIWIARAYADPRKKARKQAIEEFRATLTPAQLEAFEKINAQPIGKALKEELKRKQKERRSDSGES